MRTHSYIVAATAGVLMSVASAQAADLPSRSQAPLMAPPAFFTWTGAYIGGFAGISTGDSNVDYNFIDRSGSIFNNSRRFSETNRSSGFIGGGQVGYDYQFGNYVLGAVADIADSDYRSKNNVVDTANPNGSLNPSINLRYYGTVRGRLGYAFNRMLIYATGGFAYGETSVSGGGDASNDRIQTGYTVGGGVEYAIFDHASLFAEYDYVDLGRKGFPVTGAFGNSFTNGFGNASQVNASEHLNFSLLKVGFNYRF